MQIPYIPDIVALSAYQMQCIIHQTPTIRTELVDIMDFLGSTNITFLKNNLQVLNRDQL